MAALQIAAQFGPSGAPRPPSLLVVAAIKLEATSAASGPRDAVVVSQRVVRPPKASETPMRPHRPVTAAVSLISAGPALRSASASQRPTISVRNVAV